MRGRDRSEAVLLLAVRHDKRRLSLAERRKSGIIGVIHLFQANRGPLLGGRDGSLFQLTIGSMYTRMLMGLPGAECRLLS